jgi:hypothetical protein
MKKFLLLFVCLSLSLFAVARATKPAHTLAPYEEVASDDNDSADNTSDDEGEDVNDDDGTGVVGDEGTAAADDEGDDDGGDDSSGDEGE